MDKVEKPCLVCRDYSAIDRFAMAYNLPKFWELYTTFGPLKLPTRPDVRIVSIEALYALYKAAKDQGAADRDKYVGLIQAEAQYKSAKAECEATMEEIAEQLSQAPQQDAHKVQNELKKKVKEAQDKLAEAQKQYYNFMAQFGQKRFEDLVVEVESDVLISKTLTERLEGQFQSLLEDITIILWQTAVSEGILDPKDHVGRARLFFTWTATSIVYDKGVHGDGDTLFRDIYDVLGTGIEVCSGFATIFQTMFNIVTDEFGAKYNWNPKLKAKYIGGWARTGEQHGWNAFPCNADLSEWKIIDPCWGGSRADHQLHGPEWFVQSNDEFLLTHLPREKADQFAAQPFEGSRDDFLKRKLICKNTLPTRFKINILSIQPALPELPVGLGVQVFQFSLCCAKAPKRPFFIAVSTSNRYRNVTPFVYEGYRCRASLDLAAVPRDGSRTVVILTFTADGFLPFYDHETGVLWETPQKLRKFEGRIVWLKVAEWELAGKAEDSRVLGILKDWFY